MHARPSHGLTVDGATPAEGADHEPRLLDIVLLLLENSRLLVVGPIAVGLLTLGATFLVSPTFTATTVLVGPVQPQTVAGTLAQQLQSGPLSAGMGGGIRALRDPNDQFVSLLKSRTVEDKLIERFDLIDRYSKEFRDDAREALEARTRVSTGRDNLIRIEVDDRDPKFAAALANAYVSELRDLIGSLALTEAQQRRMLFERLVADTREKLAQAQTALSATGVEIAALRGSPEATIGPLAQLQAQIRVSEVRLGVMGRYLAESAPEYRRAQDELLALRNQMQKAGASLNAATSDTDYVSRLREFKYRESLLDLLSRQYEVAKVDESRESPVIQVVDIAIPPDRKCKPKRALLTIVSTATAGFAFIVFIFLREAFNKNQNSPNHQAKLQLIRTHLSSAFRRRKRIKTPTE